MAGYAYGGAVTKLGFGGLGVALLTTTAMALFEIRRGNVAAHREWIIRSYALMFAAVTLRIELPLLIATFGGFDPGYRIVAWLCWGAESRVRRGLGARDARRAAALAHSDGLETLRASELHARTSAWRRLRRTFSSKPFSAGA